MTDLKNKAKDCEFGELCDSLIRDRIVCGIRDDQVRVRLLREAELTLVKALDVCRASELTSTQMKVLQEEVEVQKIRTAKTNRRCGSMNESSVSNEKKFNCDRCGYKHKRKCPASGHTCSECEKKNQFAKMCRTNTQKKS